MTSRATDGTTSHSHPFPARTLGVLFHPTSIAGPEPIGTLGAEAEAWVDWLASTGAGVWQILPLTCLGDEDSPYFSPSAFAANTWLIDLRNLAEAGLLDDDDLDLPDAPTGEPVDFKAMRAWKRPLLTAAADRFLTDADHPWRADHDRFVASAPWLDDACHFFALKQAVKRVGPEAADTPWWEWEKPLRRRDPEALAASAAQLADEIRREQALQFFFDRQWQALRNRADANGITVLGDIPIYVSPDSVDVWANQRLFQLDGDGHQLTQAGVPPDYFSETGQLWKNPLYRWHVMEAEGFSWWIDRLRRTLEQVDIVRIDHFRALSAYWSVPADADTAIGGQWVPGPGQAFIDALTLAFPDLPIVAEDLGDLDDDVIKLRDDNDLVGMRVIQFGFDPPSDPDEPSVHHPDQVGERCIVYTGTHDNDTLAGWWHSLSRRRRSRVRAQTRMPPRVRTRRAVRWLIGVALRTRAAVAVVPLQDLLALGSEARMNTPSTEDVNWRWRMPPNSLTRPLAAGLRQLAEDTDRISDR
ncbi:MAG: 4-alpha-glucanotransferase [Acidimicrobiia bacterium]|nr:4-alpha-glucanotransferase [Acidimicrobiia bacterium]